MKNFNKFIKKVKSLEINPVEYIETKAGWLRKNEYPKVPFTNNSFLWEIESINENKLKILQSDAISELMLLTPDQLKQVLKRLELINSFSNFYEFIKVFYVKVANNDYNGLDISDFKINLETCFYTELPKKGNFDINFLNELLPQIFFKRSLLEGLKFQIDNLNTESQPKRDTKFALNYSKDELQNFSDYKAIKWQIEDNGYFESGLTENGITTNVKIYTPELGLILISKELPVINCKTKENIITKNWEFLKAYVEGYKKGEEYFDTEFAVNPNTLYGTNGEQYVRDIHLNYFHTNHPGAVEGWQFVKNNYPRTFYLKDIKKFGYYSGIVSKVEAMVKKYPKQFQTFDKCEHDLIQQPDKNKPKLPNKIISFKNPETVKKLHNELKGYFPNKEAELFKVLQGEQLTELLLFPHNQNRFVEVFRRLKYNGFLLNIDTETKNWICSAFVFNKKGFNEPQPFNKSSVWDNLNKGKGEPTKKERICITDWLPYKSPLQLKREAQKEQL